MKRTILAAAASGLVAMALLGGTGAPTRHSCTTGSCPAAKPALAGPAGGASVGLATYALAMPTIGSVDLLDGVGFPLYRMGIYRMGIYRTGWGIYRTGWGIYGTGWSIDPGSIAVRFPASPFALA